MPERQFERAEGEGAGDSRRGGLRGQLAYAVAGLKDRDVLKVAGLYSIGLWGAFLAAGAALPELDYRDVRVRSVVLCGAAGLPVAIVLAWFFRIGSGGIRRDAHHRPGSGNVRASEAFVNVVLVLASILLVGLSLLVL